MGSRGAKKAKQFFMGVLNKGNAVQLQTGRNGVGKNVDGARQYINKREAACEWHGARPSVNTLRVSDPGEKG